MAYLEDINGYYLKHNFYIAESMNIDVDDGAYVKEIEDLQDGLGIIYTVPNGHWSSGSVYEIDFYVRNKERNFSNNISYKN